MAALSLYAEKLLAWFNMYAITPSEYEAHLAAHPKASRRGLLGVALAELVYEGY